MADKFGLLEKLEKYGIEKILKLLHAQRGIGGTAGSAIGAGLGGPVGGMIGGAAGTGLDALRSLLTPQQPMQADTGYNPMEMMQSPYGGQMQQGMMPDFLMGGAQGLGNFAGSQLGGMSLDLLNGLGGSSSGNDFTKLLEIIPEDVIRNFLESRQAIR